MATTKTTTALATVDNFQIVSRYDGIDPEILAELQDELEDLDPENGISCRQIKVPSGGGIAYEVQGDEEGDADSMKEIEAVIVFTHRLSAYWPGTYGSGDDAAKIPVCSSMDGKMGINTSTGEITPCENCPYNQYGTGTDEKGNPSRGKACKNMRRIYMIMDSDPNCYLLTIPPTSIKDVNKQLAKILASGIPYTGLVVSFTLEKAKNGNGVTYSKVSVKKKALLPAAIAARVMELRNRLKTQYKSMAITMDDYVPAREQSRAADTSPNGAGGAAVEESPLPDEVIKDVAFEDVPPPDDSDLPFA